MTIREELEEIELKLLVNMRHLADIPKVATEKKLHVIYEPVIRETETG